MKRFSDSAKDAWEVGAEQAAAIWAVVRGASAILPVRFAAGGSGGRLHGRGGGFARRWAADSNDYRTDAAQRRADACVVACAGAVDALFGLACCCFGSHYRY